MREHKTLRWTIGIIGGLLLIAVITGYFVLRSTGFHKYALAKIIQTASSATGGRVEVGNYTFQFSPLRVDLYNVVIHGTEAPSQQPLARADHVGVGLKIISALQRKVDLKEIILDHPRINVLVDATGHSNVPEPQSLKSATHTNIFDLAIKHVGINHGEICYNDRQTALDANLYELQSQIQFQILKRQYTGTLGYHEGLVSFGTAKPVRHDMDAAFTVAESGLTVERLNMTSGASKLSMQAKLVDYSHPVLDGVYQGVLATSDLRKIFQVTSLSSGELLVNGTIHYQSADQRPFLDKVVFDGTLVSPRLGVVTPQMRTELRALHVPYKIQDGNLSAPDAHAELLGGRVNLSLSAQHLATDADYRVQGNLRSISLEALNTAAGRGGARPGAFGLTGRVDAKLDANWRGSLANLDLRSDAKITAVTSAAVASVNSATAKPIPLNGVLHIRYEGARDLLSLKQSYVRTPATEVRFDGTIGNQVVLRVQAHSDNLHEIDALALALRNVSATAGTPPPKPLGLYGSGDFAGGISGSTKAPHLSGELSARNLQVQGSRWQSLRAAVDVDPRLVALQHGELIGANQGRVTFDIKAGLRNWAYAPSSPFDIRLQAKGLFAADIQRFANLNYPITGDISANVAMHGTQLNPRGQGSVQLVNGKLWNQPVQTVSVNFTGSGESLQTNLKLQSTAGNGTGTLNYIPGSDFYDLALDLHATNLANIEALRARNIDARGGATLSVRGRGDVKDPQLKATLDVPQLRLAGEQLSNIHGQFDLARQHANFEVASSVSNSSIQTRGTIDFGAGYYTNATLDTRAFPLAPILAVYSPSSVGSLQGQFDMHATLKGLLKDFSKVEALVEISNAQAGYKTLQFASVGPIRANYRNGIVELAKGEIKGNNTNVQFQGTIPMRGTAPMNVTLRGNADLKLLNMIDRQADSAGQLMIDMSARGDRAHPNLAGKISLVNAAFSTPTAPIGLENVNGDVNIQNNRFEIVKLDGQAGGGNISMRGYAIYQSGLQFHLNLDAETIRLRYPTGLRAVLNSRLSLNGSSDAANLNGNVTVERLSFTRDFDLGTFIGQLGAGASAPPSEGIANNIELDVGVQSSGDLGLESSKLSLQGQANLRIRGTAANPVIIGRTNVTDGELFFMNSRYHIDRANIDFANPVRTEPVINLLATTTVKQFNLSINMVGPLDRLRTYYVSDPPLPPVDIINLLTRGTTTETSAPGNLGANSLLAKGLASQVSSRLEKLAGISSLQIDPLLGGSNRNPSARIALQEHITRDIIFTYAADVTSTQNELIQVEYQITPTLSMRVLRDERGNFSVEGRLHKSY